MEKTDVRNYRKRPPTHDSHSGAGIGTGEEWEMTERREYEMTEADLAELLAAMKPVPAMYLSGGQLMGASQQENANAAWRRLGERMGFQYMTVQGSSKGKRFFTAIPNPEPSNA